MDKRCQKWKLKDGNLLKSNKEAKIKLKIKDYNLNKLEEQRMKEKKDL
jgi:hypothetical protein